MVRFFFFFMVNTASSVSSFQQLIEGQDEGSCGKSGTDETPQERKREEAQRPPAESEALHGNQRRCHKRFSSCISFVRL
nr:hypothetical protein [Priestia aryabhattai]MDH3115926.1 hypothetical protein [Priestia aryabhattai]